MKKAIIIIITILNFNLVLSQKLNENYELFTNNDYSDYIEFKNDSILIRKPYYPNSYQFVQNGANKVLEGNKFKEYSYEIINDTITIFKFNNSEDTKYRFVNNKYFENQLTNEVYVLRSDFEKFPDLAVKYNDDIYWIDSPKTSNGIITKDGKKNRKLKRKLKSKKDSDFEVKLYKRYEAFHKFGYNYVFGIIEIKDKK